MNASGWDKVTQAEADEMYAEVRAEVLREAAALVRSYAPPSPEGEEEEAIAYALELAAGAVERGGR